jgi:hypothetical protein
VCFLLSIPLLQLPLCSSLSLYCYHLCRLPQQQQCWQAGSYIAHLRMWLRGLACALVLLQLVLLYTVLSPFHFSRIVQALVSAGL